MDDLENLRKNKIFKKVAEKLKIPTRVLLGLFALITKRYSMDEAESFIHYYLKL